MIKSVYDLPACNKASILLTYITYHKSDVHESHFAVFVVVMYLSLLPIAFRLTSLVLGQSYAGIILCMCPANERRCYIVTSSPVGWAHTQNDPWYDYTSAIEATLKDMGRQITWLTQALYHMWILFILVPVMMNKIRYGNWVCMSY